MIVTHKIALDPNNVQATYFAKAAGMARKRQAKPASMKQEVSFVPV